MVWTPPLVSDLPSWSGAKRIAIDLETYDPHLKDTGPSVRTGGYIIGVAFAIEDGPAHYLPVRHLGGDNLPSEQVFAYLRAQAREFRGIVTGANLQYDMDWLAEQGVTFWDAEWRDVQVADPLIYEMHMSYSLEAIAQRWNLPGKSEAGLIDAGRFLGIPEKDIKKNMWKLAGRHVAEYAIRDVTAPLEILRRQEREIDEQGLWDIFRLECQVQPVLLKMRRRGVRIDFNKLDQVEQWANQHRDDALAKVRALTGHQIESVWSAENVAPAIQSTGMQIPLTPKTRKPSIDKEFLEGMDHEVAKMILSARRYDKVSSTFAASIRRYAVNGRVHTTFNQLKKERDDGGGSAGAAYGRLSSQDPNLQQQPARDPEMGPMWRSIYVPDEGGIWVCNDFSQQEPRVLAHYAEITGCSRAKEAAEVYRTDPKADNHTMMARLMYPGFDSKPKDQQKLLRSNAKIIFLGLCYGMGGGKLARSLGLPVVKKKGMRGEYEGAGPEAQAVLDQFHKNVPFVLELGQKCEKNARQNGFIRTILGRRCRFPAKTNGGFDWTHKALNRLIQGSSADQTKKAMVDADRAGIPIQLQVHDELNMTAERMEQAKELAQVMTNSVKLNVPMRVDIETGPSWGEVK